MREEASSPNRQEASFSYFQSVLYDDQTSLIYVMPELRHKYKWFFIRVQMVLDDRRHMFCMQPLSLVPIPLSLFQLILQGLFKSQKCRYKAVTDQQEHFINFILVIYMGGCIAFS